MVPAAQRADVEYGDLMSLEFYQFYLDISFFLVLGRSQVSKITGADVIRGKNYSRLFWWWQTDSVCPKVLFL